MAGEQSANASISTTIHVIFSQVLKSLCLLSPDEYADRVEAVTAEECNKGVQ